MLSSPHASFLLTAPVVHVKFRITQLSQFVNATSSSSRVILKTGLFISTTQQSTIPVYLCPDDVTRVTDHGQSTSIILDLWLSFDYFMSRPVSGKGDPFFVSFFSNVSDQFTVLLVRDNDAIVVIVPAIFNFSNYRTYTFRFLFCTSL